MSCADLNPRLFFVLMPCLLLGACCGDRVDVSEGKITQTIIEASQLNEEFQLDLSDLHPGDWEELLVVTPYTDISRLNVNRCTRRALNGTWIQSLDRVCVLVFLGPHRSYVHVEPRFPVDFTALGQSSYSREDGVTFSLKHVGSGRFHIALAHDSP